MGTKAELEEENKKLREKLKELLGIAQKQHDLENKIEYTHKGFSIIKLDDDFKLVELEFNPVTKLAKVSNIEAASRLKNDLAMAETRGIQHLIEVIMKDVIK